MRTIEDVERFLREGSIPFQDLGDGMFVVDDPASNLHNLAIKVESPVVVAEPNAPALNDAPPAAAATKTQKAPRAQPSARRGKK